MRDYKNVRVPKKYRGAGNSGRTTVKRVSAGQSRKTGAGLRGLIKNILTVAVIAAGLYLGREAYNIATRSETFLVSGVNVRGVRHLRESDLKDVAGVFTGQNIFKADIDAAARRLNAIPWVREAKIRRRLPDKISIEVVEREPIAALDTGKAAYLIDGEGVAIEKTVMDRAERRLPVIIAAHVRPVPGETTEHSGVAAALALLAELEKRGGWRMKDVTIRADSVGSLSVIYAGNEFRLGAGNYSQKLRRLSEVTADLKRRNVSPAYIDLRPERQVAVMVRK